MKNLNPYNLTFVKVEDHDITPRERQIVDKKYDQCFKYKNPTFPEPSSSSFSNAARAACSETSPSYSRCNAVVSTGARASGLLPPAPLRCRVGELGRFRLSRTSECFACCVSFSASGGCGEIDAAGFVGVTCIVTGADQVRVEPRPRRTSTALSVHRACVSLCDAWVLARS